MIKRIVRLCFIFLTLNIVGILNVNALDVLNVSEGDTIIGHTRFEQNKTITATRAAKAGALYSKLTGNVDVNIYKYDIMGDWYIFNSDLGKYEYIAEQSKIDEIINSLKIYYNDNIPIDYLYDGTELFSYLEFGPEGLVISDNNVKLNWETREVTCPYGTEFTFRYDYQGAGTQPKKVKCGYNDILEIEEPITNIKMTLKDVVSPSDSSYKNQDKIVLTKESDKNNIINLKVIDKLEETEVNNDLDTYYAIDLIFDQKNTVSNYAVYSSAYYIRENIIEENKIRLIIPISMYNESEIMNFAIIDNEFNTYEEIKVNISGLDKVDRDFNHGNITKADASINPNSNNIRKVTLVEDEINVELLSELTTIIHNDVEAKWVTLDVEFDNIFDLNHVIMDGSISEAFDYQIDGNILRLWINYDNINAPILGLRFYYPLTTSNFKAVYLNVRFSDYITYEWGTEKDAAGQQYLYIVDGKGNKLSGIVNITYSGTNYTEEKVVTTDGILLIKNIVTINNVEKN